MRTHVALLRGINVGGRNKIAMADLREVAASLGHTDVGTYIQSGNVLFTAQETDTGAMAAALEQAIGEALGVRPGVVVISRDELRQVIRDNPYPGEPNPRYVHTVFFCEPLGPGVPEQVADAVRRAAERGGRDAAQVIGRTVFLHTPDGFGRSELATLLLGRAGSPVAGGTARNWATVTKLLALCDG